MATLEQQLQLLQQLRDLLTDTQVTHYANVAAGTLYAYDCIISVADEYEHVWKARWNVGKVLFLWTRYYYLLLLIVSTYIDLNNTLSDEGCFRWGIVHPILSIVSSSTVEFIMSYRVWALYGKARWVTFLLSFLFVAEIGTICGVTVPALMRVGVLSRPGPFLAGCYSTNVPSWFWTVFLPPTVSSFVLFVMTAVKTLKTVGDAGNIVPLISLFLRDGATYFAVISFTLLVNLFLFILAKPTLAPVALSFCYSIPSLFCCRMLLNMRMSRGKTKVAAWNVSGDPRAEQHSFSHSYSAYDAPRPFDEAQDPKQWTEMYHLSPPPHSSTSWR